MAREFSSELSSAVASTGGYAFPTLRLRFAGGRTLYLCSVEVEFDEQVWEPQIVSVGDVQASQGRAADRGSVSLKNTDLRWTQTEFALDESLIGLRAVLGEAYFDDDFDFKGHVTLLKCDVEDVTEAEDVVELQLVSDVAARKGVVGSRLIAPRCQYLYKGVECGYTGPIQICNKRLLGTDGCEGHDNEHRFGGATYLPGLSGAAGTQNAVPAAVENSQIQGNAFSGGGVHRIDLSRFQLSVL
jgi:hypothetical protein